MPIFDIFWLTFLWRALFCCCGFYFLYFIFVVSELIWRCFPALHWLPTGTLRWKLHLSKLWPGSMPMIAQFRLVGAFSSFTEAFHCRSKFDNNSCECGHLSGYVVTFLPRKTRIWYNLSFFVFSYFPISWCSNTKISGEKCLVWLNFPVTYLPTNVHCCNWYSVLKS